MNRKNVFVVVALVVCMANVGCMGRIIREGAGAAMGASGKVVELHTPSSLANYRGLTIESITVAQGLRVPGDIVTLVRQSYADETAELVLTPGVAISSIGRVNRRPACLFVQVRYHPVRSADDESAAWSGIPEIRRRLE